MGLLPAFLVDKRWIVGALFFLACSAFASNGSLVVTPSQSFGVGGPSSALYVQRLAPDGTPISTGAPALTVTVSSSSASGQFAVGATGSQTWSSTYTVTIPVDSSSSPAFYYRDGRSGTATLTANGGTSWDSPGTTQTVTPWALSDDFETGTLLSTEIPPGKWTGAVRPAQTSLQVDPAAAHRGNYGLRYTETASGTGSGGLGYLYWSPAPLAPEIYLRGWIRVTASNDLGAYMVPYSLWSTMPNPFSVYDAIDLASGVVRRYMLTGWDVAHTSQSTLTTVTAGVGEWHLMEIGGKNYGTAAGSRFLWIDGLLIASESSNIDWTGANVNQINIGDAYNGQHTWTGILDFDDIRISTSPPASTLTLQPAGPFIPGQCTRVDVVLLASSFDIAPALYDMPLALSSQGVSGEFYADSTCTSAATVSAFIPSGASLTSVYFKPSQLGAVTLKVAHPDFVSQPLVAFSVTGQPLQAIPSSINITPGFGKQFNATGGVGIGYLWSFTANNSGATLTADGMYTAGPRTGVTDGIQVIDVAGGTAQVTIHLMNPPSFRSEGATHALCAEPYRYSDIGTPVVDGTGPMTFSLVSTGGSIDGLSIDPATGEIHWIPTRGQAGRQTFGVQVTDLAGSAVQEVAVDVECPVQAARVRTGCSSSATGPMLSLLLIVCGWAIRRRSSM